MTRRSMKRGFREGGEGSVVRSPLFRDPEKDGEAQERKNFFCGNADGDEG